jgi:hypothetical protein
MDQSELDSRIEAAKRRAAGETAAQIPGQFEKHPITVEQGDQEIPNTSRLNDITLKMDDAAKRRENSKEEQDRLRAERKATAGQPGGIIGDAYRMPDGEGSEPVKVGTVTLRKTGLVGYERAYTPNASDYQLVLASGEVLNSVHEIVKHLHAEMWSIKQAKQAKQAGA